MTKMTMAMTIQLLIVLLLLLLSLLLLVPVVVSAFSVGTINIGTTGSNNHDQYRIKRNIEPNINIQIQSSSQLSSKNLFGMLLQTKAQSQSQSREQQQKSISISKLHRMRMYSSVSTESESDTSDTSTDTNIYDCIVLGGGISGCTVAHNLYYNGKIDNIILAESNNYLGGNVKSHRTSDGFLWEEGPNSFATSYSILRISYELNILKEIVFANETLPPWILYNKQLHPLPKGQGSKGIKGQIELLFGPNGIFQFIFNGQLLSWPGKIRAGIGAFIGHLPPPTLVDTSSVTITKKEESIQEWIIRILGTEVYERCIDPFISGIYAGNPQTLGMNIALPKISNIESIAYNISWNQFGGALFYGGLLRQVQLTKERKDNPPNPEWGNIDFEYGNPGSYYNGLSTLPNAVSIELGQPLNNDTVIESSKVRLNYKVIKVEKDETMKDNKYPIYLVTFQTPNGIKIMKSKSIVSTIPAHALQNIFTTVVPVVDEICTYERNEIQRIGIYYPPVAAVTIAYPKSSFINKELSNNFGNLQNLPGFGLLYPRSQNIRTLGTLWTSSLFPNRCPSNYNLLLNYIGGSRDSSIGTMSHEEIIKEVDNSCRQCLIRPDAPPPKIIGIKLWPTAIPQYELGHSLLLTQLQESEKNVNGIYICGNYRTGVAFPDCVTFGYNQAQTVINYLTSIQNNNNNNNNNSPEQQQQQQQQQLQDQNAVPKSDSVVVVETEKIPVS